jgi:hypothetical protein
VDTFGAIVEFEFAQPGQAFELQQVGVTHGFIARQINANNRRRTFT